VEDALFQANRKLNLLNSITRHDIINSLTALFLLAFFLPFDWWQKRPSRQRDKWIGKLLGREGFSMQGTGSEEPVVTMTNFVEQYYAVSQNIPPLILLQYPVNGEEVIKSFLSKKRGRDLHAFSVHQPGGAIEATLRWKGKARDARISGPVEITAEGKVYLDRAERIESDVAPRNKLS
jgi:hypothetical protein